MLSQNYWLMRKDIGRTVNYFKLDIVSDTKCAVNCEVTKEIAGKAFEGRQRYKT